MLVEKSLLSNKQKYEQKWTKIYYLRLSDFPFFY